MCRQTLLQLINIFQGIRWSNLFESDIDNITFGGILLLIVVDLVLYMLIALYIEAIYPGEYGVPQKWYFIFTPEFWRKKNHDQGINAHTTGKL